MHAGNPEVEFIVNIDARIAGLGSQMPVGRKALDRVLIVNPFFFNNPACLWLNGTQQVLLGVPHMFLPLRKSAPDHGDSSPLWQLR